MLDSDWSPKACPFAGVDFSNKAKLSVFTRYLKSRLLPTFTGVLWEKIRMCVGFTNILANYTSEESLQTAVYNKTII